MLRRSASAVLFATRRASRLDPAFKLQRPVRVVNGTVARVADIRAMTLILASPAL